VITNLQGQLGGRYGNEETFRGRDVNKTYHKQAESPEEKPKSWDEVEREPH